MENKAIKLEITKEDGILYDFLNEYQDEYKKAALKSAASLYYFSVGDLGCQEGHLSPKYMKEEIKSYSVKELKELRNSYLNELMEDCRNCHPDNFDCGIQGYNPDSKYWFIGDNSIIGSIALLINYIDVIDDLLKEDR